MDSSKLLHANEYGSELKDGREEKAYAKPNETTIFENIDQVGYSECSKQRQQSCYESKNETQKPVKFPLWFLGGVSSCDDHIEIIDGTVNVQWVSRHDVQ